MAFKWSVVGLALLTGCGTSAIITRRNGPAVDAKIVGGDRENVYVEAPSGGSYAVPRSEITDIDHPGNVAAILGGVVTGYGAVNIAVGLPQCGGQDPSFCVGVFLPTVVGTSMMAWGISTHTSSVGALNESPKRKPRGRIFVMPTHRLAGQPDTPGVSLGGTF